MAITTHQLVINLPYRPIKCLFFLVCVGFALFLSLQTLISIVWNSETEELNDRFLNYHFQSKNQEKHQCDGRGFKCAPYSHLNVSKIIPYNRRCDGRIDCPSGDDEAHCQNCQTSFSCPSHDNSSLICLRSEKLCNDYSDCPRGEDELLPQCKEAALDYMEMWRRIDKHGFEGGCKEDEFSCRGIKCIPKEKVCDGEIDCVMEFEALDELNCKKDQCQGKSQFCAKPISRIFEDVATIYDHIRGHMNCLPPWMQCDGTIDCLDYSDEHFQHCKNVEECPGLCFLNLTDQKYVKSDVETFESRHYNHFGGYTFPGQTNALFEHNVLCDNGQWVNKIVACSGHYPTCEKHCQKCTLGAFMCKTENRCLMPGLICDGVKDCKDGSDEEKCQDVTKDCNDPFRRCNGFVDCDDGRDEKNCTTCSTIPNISQMNKDSYTAYREPTYFDYEKGFHCKNDSMCVSHLKRCNGVQDCLSGEDEEGCSCYLCLMHPQRMYICKQGKRCFKWNEVCNGTETRCPNPDELDKQYCLNRTLNAVQN